MMAVHLVECCCGDQMTEHVADGETQGCMKGEILDCFDLCLSLYTSLFGTITASISCLNFRLVSSWLGFFLISSSGICSWNDLRTQRQPHDQQRLLFPFLSRCAGPSAAYDFQTTPYWPGICPSAHLQAFRSGCTLHGLMLRSGDTNGERFRCSTHNTQKALSISLWKGSRRCT